MKKIFLTMTALSALAAAAPAAAQYPGQAPYPGQYGQYPGQTGYGSVAGTGAMHRRAQRVQVQIDTGVRRGTISRSEARRLHDQLRQFTQLERQYRINGINGRERADLRLRLRNLRQQVRYAERFGNGYDSSERYDRNHDGWDDRDLNRDGRWDVDSSYDRNGDGWDDRDMNRDGRWDVERSYDRNNDGWDDRDVNRDGGWDDERSGNRVDADWDDDNWDEDDRGDWQNRQGGWGQAPATSVFGVGTRAPTGLSPVPPQYQSRFRDGNGVYYRYDDGRVFQIDARTNLILRVDPLN